MSTGALLQPSSLSTFNAFLEIGLFPDFTGLVVDAVVALVLEREIIDLSGPNEALTFHMI